jgi:tetratricopeptide (TPR) repeat protein
VLILDDSHFCDSATLGFVHYFARRSPKASVFFVATARIPAPVGFDVTTANWEGVKEIELSPLTQGDLEALIARFPREPGAEPASAIDLGRLTGGNPLLVVSLLATAPGDRREIPRSIVQFFRPRLNMLSRDGSVLLAAISLHGAPLDFELAARIAGIDFETVSFAQALQELEAAALTVTAGETVRPRHGVIGEVAIAALSPADSKALHARSARILAEEGRAPPAVLAVRHDIAGEKSKSYQAALSAAEASRALHATREREFFLKLALSNAPNDESDAQIRIELADLYRHIGRPQEGLEIVAEQYVLTAPAPSQSRALASRLAIQFQLADPGRFDSRIWEDLLNLSPDIDPDVTAELFYLFAAMAHGLGRASDAVAATRRALAIIGKLTPNPRTALVASRAAVGVGLYMSAEEGLAEIERLLPLVESNVEALGQCISAHATLLVALGRLPIAERRFLEAIDLIERCYLYGSLYGIHNNLGVCYTGQGRYVEAKTQFELATRAGREFGRPGDRGLVEENIAMLHWEQGDFGRALQTARPVGGDSEMRTARALYTRHGMVGLCSLELGLLAQAFESKREIELLFDQHEYWSNDVSYVETFLARMLVLEDRAEEARERLETAIEVYRPRDLLCRARLELELARIDLKRNPQATMQRSEAMLETLRGTGARPLIDRFEEMADRAQRRHPA